MKRWRCTNITINAVVSTRKLSESTASSENSWKLKMIAPKHQLHWSHLRVKISTFSIISDTFTIGSGQYLLLNGLIYSRNSKQHDVMLRSNEKCVWLTHERSVLSLTELKPRESEKCVMISMWNSRLLGDHLLIDCIFTPFMIFWTFNINKSFIIRSIVWIWDCIK